MTETIRVGIVGASAHGGWARESHVPAIQAVDGLELVAVAARRQKSADEAAAAFGLPRGYGDPAELMADPDIDVVVVTAPVPAHHDLLTAALQAGKHVVTEWPVGVSTAQTEQLARVARRSDRRSAVGLQTRLNPATIRAAEMLAQGAIGRVLSATVYSSTSAFGPTVPAAAAYLEQRDAGMNLTTIQTAHTVDFAVRLLGSLTSFAALATIQYPDLQVEDSPDPLHRTIADHVLIQGRITGGAALAVQTAGGRPPEATPFRFEATGTDGTLTIDGGAPRGFQTGLLQLTLNGQPVAVTDPLAANLPPSAVNVAHLYTAVRDDIRSGTTTAPDFDHAIRLAHLVDDLHAAMTDQRTVTPTADWP